MEIRPVFMFNNLETSEISQILKILLKMDLLGTQYVWSWWMTLPTTSFSLIPKALDTIFKSVHSSETGHQFFISFKSPFFDRRVITAHLQLNGNRPSARLSLSTASKSSLLLIKKSCKSQWGDHLFQVPCHIPCSAVQSAIPLLKWASEVQN